MLTAAVQMLGLPRVADPRPSYGRNYEKLRIPANRSGGTVDTRPHPFTPTRHGQWEGGGGEDGEKTTEKEVGSFPREESLLLRWEDHHGPAEWGATPHPGPHPTHQCAVLHI